MSWVSCACRKARASAPAACSRPYWSSLAARSLLKVESPFYSLPLLKTLFALVFLGTLAAAGYAAWYVVTPIPVATLPATFDLPPGTRFRAAVPLIRQAGVAVEPIGFEILARALGRDQSIKAGNYELSAAPTPLELLEKLTRGDVTQDEVRLIEGWNIRQLRAALDASKSLRHDSAGVDGPQLLARLGAREGHPEGLFFPDTYLFAKGTSDLHVLKRAYDAMQRHLAREWAARDPKSPYKTPYEALIMASIIEKETGK